MVDEEAEWKDEAIYEVITVVNILIRKVCNRINYDDDGEDDESGSEEEDESGSEKEEEDESGSERKKRMKVDQKRKKTCMHILYRPLKG
jgi:hypothetical protein